MIAGLISRSATKTYLGAPATAWALGIIFLVSVAFYWHGFGPAGDAERYVAAALKWKEEGAHLGDNHWALRHLYVLPMAASYALLGPSEFATTLPNILYAAGLVAITYLFGRRYFDESEAFLTAAFVAVSAFFVARPMEIGVYGPEVMFAAAACWLYLEARHDGARRIPLLVAAGLMSGLSWTLREQTVYLIIAFGALALMERRKILISLFALGAGFGSILLFELLGYFLASGDAFYRYHVDLQHRTVGWDATIDEKMPLVLKLIRPFKDAIDDPITTPLLLLGVAAAVWLGKGLVAGQAKRRDAFVVFGVVSVISAVISSYVFDFAKPRYFPVLHYTVVLVLACATVGIARRFNAALAAGFAGLVLFLNVAGEDFSNYNEFAEARLLGKIAEASSEPIFVDPMTASRARHYLRLLGETRDGVSAKIRHGDAPPGALFYKAYSYGQRRSANWCVIERRDDVRPESWTHALIRWSGADRVLGERIRNIVSPPPPVEIIRVLDAPGSIDPATGAACRQSE